MKDLLIGGENALERGLDEEELVWSGRELVWAGDGRLYLRGVGRNILRHPYIEEAHRRVLEDYTPPKGRLLLLIPCSYGKPYSQSYIHYMIQRALVKAGLYDRVHQVILTNAGVVPRELEEHYPYVAYDWNPLKETLEVKEEYTRILEERLSQYLDRFWSSYTGAAAFLRHDSDSWRAVERVAASGRHRGFNPPNLAPRSVEEGELEEVHLNLPMYREDPDVILVTRSSLTFLIEGLRSLLP